MTEFAAHVEDFCTRLFEDIRKLTADTCGVTREGYTPEEDKVHERLAEAAREIGLEVHADAALNLWMTLPGRNRDLPAFVSGSHTDSVPQGGNYDGLAGIVAPLAVAKYLKDTNRVPEQDFCIVAFRMEECPEFGRAYSGSLALTGQLKPFELELPHRDSGRLLKDVLLERGVDVERIASGEPLMDLSKIAAFVELHIEQGPRLDKEPVNRAAVVTGIRGYLRHKRCRVEGETAHSGAVDYEFRHDAVAALTDLLYVMNRHWEAWLHDGKDLVFTCGVINTPSTADISIISGDVSFGLDMRSLSMETIRAFHDLLLEEAAAIEEKHGVKFIFDDVIVGEAARPDAILFNRLVKAATDHGIPHLQMASGAGHDAVVMTSAGVPTCMLFVANQNGSHTRMRRCEFRISSQVRKFSCTPSWIMIDGNGSHSPSHNACDDSLSQGRRVVTVTGHCS